MIEQPPRRADERRGMVNDERLRESPATALLYRRLLELEHATGDAEPILDRALFLIVEVTSASLCFVELFADNNATIWKAHDASGSDPDTVRSQVSRGIVTHMLSAKATIRTPSAAGDDRFGDLDSVRQRVIPAVLCSPIGVAEVAEPSGVIYLEGEPSAGPFSDDDADRIEMAAKTLARVGPRLILRRRIVASLSANGWNLAATGRELGVSRTHLYKLIDKLAVTPE